MLTMVAFLDGVGFDPFFRGLLSVVTMFIVLCGATYLIVASNVGVRQGFLLSGAGLFGWMFIMGIIWTTYESGWEGEAQSWSLLEINADGVAFSDVDTVQSLESADLDNDEEDPEKAQEVALEKSEQIDIDEWRYLTKTDPERGEAQSAAETFLLEEKIFEANGYIPLAFGAFNTGGKPLLVEDPSSVDRVKQFFNETFLHPVHSQELMVIQFQAVKEQLEETGGVPLTPVADPEEGVVSVVMERDRGGPIPSLIGGGRFTPLMFTIFNGLIFFMFAFVLHNKDLRERAAVAGAA